MCRSGARPVSDPRPIGVFDSGVGGLSILFELQRLLPHEDFVYYADTLRCPWGSREPTEIGDLAAQATEALLAEGAKLIVVACNSATTQAIGVLRERFAVPFVGTVPAVRPAARLTQTGTIAILATAATSQSATLRALIDEFAANVTVSIQPVPDRVVECVEAGIVDGPEIEDLLSGPVRAAEAAGADVLVLGCTHYAFVRSTIRALSSRPLTLLDTGEPVARQAARRLHELGLASPSVAPGVVRYRATADLPRLEALADTLHAVYRRAEVSAQR